MRPHQSCGLLCQLNHPLTREKSTVDKQHQFQRLARMNLNTATRPSRTAVSHQMDQLDVIDRPTCGCRMMCCCSRCWKKRQLTRISHSPGAYLRSPTGREVNPRADAGQRRKQEARDWRCAGTDSPAIGKRSRFICLLYSEAAGPTDWNATHSLLFAHINICCRAASGGERTQLERRDRRRLRVLVKTNIWCGEWARNSVKSRLSRLNSWTKNEISPVEFLTHIMYICAKLPRGDGKCVSATSATSKVQRTSRLWLDYIMKLKLPHWKATWVEFAAWNLLFG